MLKKKQPKSPSSEPTESKSIAKTEEFELARLKEQLVLSKRTLEIEAALERVRSRSLAMHKSEDLLGVINTVSEQLQQLGIKFHNTSFGINSDGNDYSFWMASPHQPHPYKLDIPYLANPMSDRVIEAKKNKKDFFADELSKKDNLRWHEHIIQHTGDNIFTDEVKSFVLSRNGYARSTVFMKNIFLTVGNYVPKPYLESENEIFRRFARVFDQSYTRFLDLQKAEAQAREAQIEAALEKVRSRSLAMDTSEQLADLSLELVKQVQALGIATWFCAFNIYDDHELGSLEWGSNGEGVFPKYRTPREGIFLRYFKKGQQEESLLINEIGEDECPAHYDYLCSLPGVGDQLLKMKAAGIAFPTYQIDHVAYFKYGYIIYITYKPVLEAHEIFKRFAKVFEQTYTRFLDIQKAEAQTREAQIEAALERVRSRSMAMHKSDELLEVISVVSEQLQQLEIRFDSVSFVINNNDKSYKFWVATRGLPNPVFLDVPYIDIPMFMQLQAAQEQGLKFYTDVLDQKENKRWQEHMFKYVNEDLFSDEAKEYVISRGLARSVAIFPNIMLILSNFASVAYSESDNDIITRFGQVFDQTYTRFLDLQKAELQALKAEQDLIEIKVAREKAEAALAELQLTQKQLIQSEKMASLGELTAGIAHEIQNPLNFVNNFSEVSTELVDEMKSEIDAGNSEEAKEIATDLKENLQKINHHGKRAGDIVKGMLQHSRSSSGQKELTDINALTDEYLRLAYHGLRAKDKSFNASMKTEFDDTIEKINVVPQDIGRVILNLITNAFYAVNDKKKSTSEGYDPVVTVSTKKMGDRIEVTVKDNGNGIPEHIKDKIFQPFFTTKPTGQGTGLGLSLSYDIVKTHGGELMVETKEGEGSTFLFDLPFKTP